MTATVFQFPVPPKLSRMEAIIEQVLDYAKVTVSAREDLKLEITEQSQVFQSARTRAAATSPPIDEAIWQSMTDVQRQAILQWTQAFMDHLAVTVELPAFANAAAAGGRVLQIKEQVRAMGFEI